MGARAGEGVARVEDAGCEQAASAAAAVRMAMIVGERISQSVRQPYRFGNGARRDFAWF
jgi:hypothetical protein